MKYIVRFIAFGWLMYLIGAAVASIGQVEPAMTLTSWVVFKDTMFVLLILFIGFCVGAETYNQ